MHPDLTVAFTDLLSALERLEIHHMLAGSTKVKIDDVPELVEVLAPNFYIDQDTAVAAVRSGRPFNVIHFKTAFNIDLIPLRPGHCETVQFDRRDYTTSRLFGTEEMEYCVMSPEDVILSKLSWYRAGGRVSQQQWGDVMGVIDALAERPRDANPPDP
jgi:hypothetical protein